MKRDIAKEIYKFYRSGSRKLRGGQDEEVREKNTDPTTLESVFTNSWTRDSKSYKSNFISRRKTNNPIFFNSLGNTDATYARGFT
jgi:hypothetical protein